MRTFMLGSVTDRKIVVIELNGTCMSVVRMMPDGSTKRSEKDLSSESEARAASEQMAGELISRGYMERTARGSQPATPNAAASKPATRVRQREEVNPNAAFDDIEAPAATAAPVLARLASAPSAERAAEDAPKKKKKTGGKKKKKTRSGDALDKRVLAAIAAVAVAFIGFIGYVVYDGFLKPSTIVGTWRGGMVEHEISRRLTLTEYDLILDEQKRASLTLQHKSTWIGTYAVQGDRLKLTLMDEDGDPSERVYKIVLARVTLELYDPKTDKLLVQLLRFREKPVVGKAPPPRSRVTDESEEQQHGADAEGDAEDN
jgi:hypothetical protein